MIKINKESKKQNAITLIALVITIIVLLILAGVSIATLTGENGILMQATKAKEETRAGEIKEYINLLVTENEISKYTDGTQMSKEDAINKLKEQGKLTDEEIAELQTKDKITIGGVEIDFGVLNGGNNNKFKVEYTTSEGTELWSSTVTFNITFEEEINFNLEQKRELVAYMYDCENYEEVFRVLEKLADKAYEENGQIPEKMELIWDAADEDGNLPEDVENAMLDELIEYGKDFLSYRDIEKLERLGVKVITIETPYGTKLYTSSFGKEVLCTFCENGEYEFNITSGENTIKEKVKISNIRDFNTQGPHSVYSEVDFSDINSSLLYTTDDSETKKELEKSVFECDNSFTVHRDTNDVSYNAILCERIEMNKEFYKYFNSLEEWTAWQDSEYFYPGLLLFKTLVEGLEKSRHFIFEAWLYDIEAEQVEGLNDIEGVNEVILDMANDLLEEANGDGNLIWGYCYDTEDMSEEILEKYPQSKIVGEYGINTIEVTRDMHIGYDANYCFTTDMYVEVAVWDEEKKKWLRKRKKVKDITYDDELLVWDFDKGEFTTAKPLWIMRPKVATSYNLLKFSDGSELKTIDQHRIYNKEKGKFTYPMTDETPIGTTTYTAEGKEVQLVSKEKIVVKEVEYMNIITKYHINVFVNNILTSCRFSNLYPIEDMKYVKDEREIIGKEEYANIPEEYYYGLRLGEQPREVNRKNDVKHDNNIEEYIRRIMSNTK